MPPSVEQLERMRAELAARDPALARVHAAVPPFAWRTRPGGFVGLAWMIVGQQVSTASAAAIWRRVEAGLDAVTPQAVADTSPETLRALGLSTPKARYLREIAQAQLSGRIDFDRLSELSDEAATARLTAITGVGRWTAETYLMFCEGRVDVFPGADVALQEAIRWADRADRRPSEREACARAETWRPLRSTAAHLLWAWYGGVRRGEIAAPMS
ncbi:MAG TPA: DNA-3-methyladenine glycosylase 2 family protein [Caulobacteraceae bacterium]|nr:DNA-3-methyladenine glycosylase 2 family protein [Caulobacteraceae bacterium]